MQKTFANNVAFICEQQLPVKVDKRRASWLLAASGKQIKL